MTVTLIIVACLGAAPDICREDRQSIDMGNGLSCMVQGQQLAARWIADHPRWMLRGWRCRFGDGKDI